MRYLILFLFAASSYGAVVTNPLARIGNYPIAVYNRTNLLLGPMTTGSNAATRAFSLNGASLLLGDTEVDGLTVNGAILQIGASDFYSTANFYDTANFSGETTISSLNGVVNVPAAGHITNIVNASLPNNTTVRLAPGTHTISAFREADSQNAHLRIVAKTNIVIEGAGWDSIIFSATLGSFVHVAHSYNITFRNLALIGTTALWNASSNGLFAAVGVYGTNLITFENVLFKNHSDHAFWNISTEAVGKNTEARFINCTFEDISSTNIVNGSAKDGTAIHAPGNNLKIIGCTFRRVRWALEFEGLFPNGVCRGVTLERCTFREGKDFYIRQVGFSTVLQDLVIDSCDFEYDAQAAFVPSTGIPISLEMMDGVRIRNSTFRGCEAGLVLAHGASQSFSKNLTGISIIGNKFTDITNGTSGHAIWLAGGAGAWVDGALVMGNTISNCQWAGVMLYGARRTVVNDNIFDHVGSGNPYGNPVTIQDAGGGSTSASNRVHHNTVIKTLAGPAFGVFSGSYNVFENNDVKSWGTAPYEDAGIGNKWAPNWFGTNFVPHIAQTNSMVTTFAGGTLGGTNIIWNVGITPMQVVVVTNTALLIITNSGSINMGTRGRIVLINNGTTNVGVFATAAGVRLMGPDGLLLASATAAAHNSLTNGRAMVLESDYVGTNHVVTVTHQR